MYRISTAQPSKTRGERGQQTLCGIPYLLSTPPPIPGSPPVVRGSAERAGLGSVFHFSAPKTGFPVPLTIQARRAVLPSANQTSKRGHLSGVARHILM